jgi:TonB family protein
MYLINHLLKKLLKNFLFIGVSFILSTQFVNGQKLIKTEFLKDLKTRRPVKERNAAFAEQKFKEVDGNVRFLLINIESKDTIYNFNYTNEIIRGIPAYDLDKKALTQPLEDNFTPPVFPLENNDFNLFVAKNLMYPQEAQEKGVEGIVRTMFFLDEQGEVSQLSVIQGAHETLDKEAARVISSSPKWAPAKVNGQPTKILIIKETFFVLL